MENAQRNGEIDGFLVVGEFKETTNKGQINCGQLGIVMKAVDGESVGIMAFLGRWKIPGQIIIF